MVLLVLNINGLKFTCLTGNNVSYSVTGSILGPLLFLVYINDLDLVSKEVLFNLYADDTNIFLTDKNEYRLITRMNNVLDRIHIWFKCNILSLNDVHLILIANNAQYVSQDKFLCVIIDDRFNWKKHISIGILQSKTYFVEKKHFWIYLILCFILSFLFQTSSTAESVLMLLHYQ